MFSIVIDMNLMVQQLKSAIAELAKRKGIVGARVLEKVNGHGEVVIALILPHAPSSPPKRDIEEG